MVVKYYIKGDIMSKKLNKKDMIRLVLKDRTYSPILRFPPSTWEFNKKDTMPNIENCCFIKSGIIWVNWIDGIWNKCRYSEVKKVNGYDLRRDRDLIIRDYILYWLENDNGLNPYFKRDEFDKYL